MERSWPVARTGARAAFVSRAIFVSGLLIASAGIGSEPALAQTADAPAPVPAAAVPTVNLDPPTRFYGGVEYLRWSVKDVPLSVPLLSTGPFSEPSRGGFLRTPESTVLYGAPHAPAMGGNDIQSLPSLSGSRLTLGYWLDDTHTRAVEASGFLFGSQSASFSASGNAGGNPGMRIPLYNSVPYIAGGVGMVVGPTEDGVPVSLPGDLTGTAKFNSSLQLGGAEASGVMTLYRSPSWELSGLAGFRYLYLSERFNLNLNIVGFANTPYAGESGSAADDFKTENQFFGGSPGLRARYHYGRLSAELTARLGLGLSHETESVSGSYQDYNTPIVTAIPGVTNGLRVISQGPNGVFAQPSNEGRGSTNKFAVVPEVQIKLGYDVTPAIRVEIGYDFLYDSSVLRPTDQIDRSFSKGLPFQQDPNSTVGPVRTYKSTDFYAQGLSLGVTYRF